MWITTRRRLYHRIIFGIAIPPPRPRVTIKSGTPIHLECKPIALGHRSMSNHTARKYDRRPLCNIRIRRHDAQVRLLAGDLAEAARHPIVEERPLGRHRERPDIRALGRTGGTDLFDVTICHPLSQARIRDAVQNSLNILKAAWAGKVSRYAAMVLASGWVKGRNAKTLGSRIFIRRTGKAVERSTAPTVEPHAGTLIHRRTTVVIYISLSRHK